MRVRNGLVSVVAAVSLAVLGTGGVSVAHAAGPSGTAPSSGRAAVAACQLTLAQLTSKVMAEVQAQYPSVTTLMLASGESPTGPTTVMTDVTHWEFVINNSAEGAVGSVDVLADLDGTISGMTTNAQRWGGVLPIIPPVTMEPTEAYSILQAAGHTDAYQFVSLVKPLVADPHLQYHFSNTLGGQGYAVNTDVPHTVAPILPGALGALEPDDC